MHEGYTSSGESFDTLSISNIFVQTDIAQGMIFRGKRRGMILKWTVTVGQCYHYVEVFKGCIQWYMMYTKALSQI